MAASSSPCSPAATAADGKSRSHDAPSCALLNCRLYIADRPNVTTAKGFTRSGRPIEVSLWSARPPHAFCLCVHCPGLQHADFARVPEILATGGNFILFRVILDEGDGVSYETFNFFLYQPGTADGKEKKSPPSLVRLPHPGSHSFGDNEVAVLPSGSDGGYVIAALRCVEFKTQDTSSRNRSEFWLRLYRSSTQRWTTKVVPVDAPVRDRVCPDPDKALQRQYHVTTKVITLGGTAVGWVDLWRGMLLCDDVLDENPVLRDMPLPFPSRGNWNSYLKGPPDDKRDIIVDNGKREIKYIEMETFKIRKEQDLSAFDSYQEWLRRGKHTATRYGWKATTWSIPLPAASWEDWRLDSTVDVSQVADESNPSQSCLLPGLDGSERGQTRGASAFLTLVYAAHPIISMDNDVFYFLSKASYKDSRAWMIAVDTRNKKLQGVAQLDNSWFIRYHRATEISKYLADTTAGEALDFTG